MQIWKPSKVKLAESQAIIDAQKRLIDALKEKNAACEAMIVTQKNIIRTLEKKTQLIENGPTEVWALKLGEDPKVKKVGNDPRTMRFYITEEAALKALERYLITGETPEAENK